MGRKSKCSLSSLSMPGLKRPPTIAAVARMMSGIVIARGDSAGGAPAAREVLLVMVIVAVARGRRRVAPCAALFESSCEGRPIVQPRKSPKNVMKSARHM